MDINEASKTVKEKLGSALNKKPNSTISISKEGTEWNATVEVVEEEYLPGKNLQSMNDIIGVYEVKLDDGGDLTSWVKKGVHKRGS
jgi:hypothetical protein